MVASHPAQSTSENKYNICHYSQEITRGPRLQNYLTLFNAKMVMFKLAKISKELIEYCFKHFQ